MCGGFRRPAAGYPNYMSRFGRSGLHIGVCRVSLYLPGVQSLKGKRQIARSINARIRNQFNVAVAEVEDQDLWQRLTLGICCNQ